MNSAVAKGRTFPPTYAVPLRVPEGNAVTFTSFAPRPVRFRRIGREVMSGADAETSTGPDRSARAPNDPVSFAVTAIVVPFVLSWIETVAPATPMPPGSVTRPARVSAGTTRSREASAVGTSWDATATVRPARVTLKVVVPE